MSKKADKELKEFLEGKTPTTIKVKRDRVSLLNWALVSKSTKVLVVVKEKDIKAMEDADCDFVKLVDEKGKEIVRVWYQGFIEDQPANKKGIYLVPFRYVEWCSWCSSTQKSKT